MEVRIDKESSNCCLHFKHGGDGSQDQNSPQTPGRGAAQSPPPLPAGVTLAPSVLAMLRTGCCRAQTRGWVSPSTLPEDPRG